VDRLELTQLLHDLGNELTSPCDVILVGGAAMILYFGATRVTRDVDALLWRGDALELRRATAVVARRHHLPEDWMNDAVKGFADILPPDFPDRLVPIGSPLERLRLHVLGRPEQVAMKVVALREQDLEDLELLLPQLSQSDRRIVIAIVDHVATFRPDWAQKMRYFLLEQGWEID
jgi:hypothetical protein